MKDLSKINNIIDYINALNEIKSDYLIMIAVKDNAGFWLRDDTQRALNGLGLKENLVSALMVGYIAVIYNGNLIHEYKSVPNKKASYSSTINGVDIFIESRPWSDGNSSSIKVNGVDYSINTRGLNFVIYDFENEEVIDRAVFDSHVSDIPCKHLKPHYDVALVGCWWGANYGSCLNGYAIYTILKQLGKSVLLINKHDVGPDDWELKDTHNFHFMKRYYEDVDVSPLWASNELYRLNDLVDTFISGSDQIWNYGIFRKFRHVFMLKFVDDNHRRISFGTSFGRGEDVTPSNELHYQRSLLAKYNAISVRENSGVKICKDVYGLNATKVAEPVFCISKSNYLELADESDFDTRRDYILAYILDPNEHINKLLEYYSEKLGKQVLVLLDGDPRVYEDNKQKVSVGSIIPGHVNAADVMKLYRDSSFVITDSFHGTAFSIIFNKQFISIKNYRRGGNRFDELLDGFGLKDRLIDSLKDETVFDKYYRLNIIDFADSNNYILKIQRESINWLENAINTPIKKIRPVVKHKIYADLERARVLVALIKEYGIRHIVMSSGTRNVNLARLFEANNDYFKIFNVSDERSAAYFAIGLATKLQETVAICCTSGTAASNYVPGVTEAFYQKVPLLVITADRYPELHGNMEDQTIIQYGLFDTCTKKSVTLPTNQDPRNMWESRLKITDAILEINHHGNGPTHINIPQAGLELSSCPKYALVLSNVKKIERVMLEDSDEIWKGYAERLSNCNRIMIVYGQNNRLNCYEEELLDVFSSHYNCVILTDSLSNYEGKYAISPYRLLRGYSQKDYNDKLSPDLIIHIGGMRILNCPLTEKIRGGFYNIDVWRVAEDGELADRYRRLSTVFECHQVDFFKKLIKHNRTGSNNGEYYSLWKKEVDNKPYEQIQEWNSKFTMQKLMKKIPSGSLLHLAVGNTFYYAPNYEVASNVEVFCNMGTNGIDGCASSFMGQVAAAEETQLCFLMIGDLSFFYDMNSILNKRLTNNVRILLNNDGGAGLLRYLNSSSLTQEHGGLAEGWVRNCGYEYMYADNKEDFIDQLDHFVDPNATGPIFFETILP